MATKANRIKEDEYKNPIPPLWVSHVKFAIGAAIALFTLYYMSISS